MSYEWEDARSWENVRDTHLGMTCNIGDHDKYDINKCDNKAIYETTLEWDKFNNVFEHACFLCEEHFNTFILKNIDDVVDVWEAPEIVALHELQELMTCLYQPNIRKRISGSAGCA